MSFGAQYKKIKAKIIRTDDDALKAEYDLAQLYRNVFGTEQGQKVLEHMLADLHFFDETAGETEDIKRNYARRLLALMGIWRPINAEQIVSGFMAVNWRKPFTTEDEK